MINEILYRIYCVPRENVIGYNGYCGWYKTKEDVNKRIKLLMHKDGGEFKYTIEERKVKELEDGTFKVSKEKYSEVIIHKVNDDGNLNDYDVEENMVKYQI